MINDENLSNDLRAFEEELRQQPLQARPADRDRLMFDCGRAAAADVTETPGGPTIANWFKQGLLVACSIFFGAFLHKQVNQADSTSPKFASNDFEGSRESNALTSKLNELYSAEQIAAVRSHQMLCVSSNPEIVGDLRLNPTTISPDPSPALRARTINRFGLMP
ncbi:MAG: hypothetical protein AAFU85_32955 [Planctomycetota bacterium]